MKAVLVHRPGGPEALDYTEVPVPALGEQDVLIRAKAFGVGQPDKLIRSGVYKWMPPLPANPGNDVAGEIEAIGAQVTGIAVGQRVLLSARDLAQRGGCYAEYVAAPADAVHVLPGNVAFEDAGLPAQLSGRLGAAAQLRLQHPAHSALVIGAAGGVGTSLVQLAKLAGMKVIGPSARRRRPPMRERWGRMRSSSIATRTSSSAPAH
jgi:NADPH2:quinone reductase